MPMTSTQIKAYCRRKANGSDPHNAYLNALRGLEWGFPERVVSDLLKSARHSAKMQVEGQPLEEIIESYRLMYEAYIDLLQRLGVQNARARTAYTKQSPAENRTIRVAGMSHHTRTRREKL